MYRKLSGLRMVKLFLYAIALAMGGMLIPIFFAFIPAMFLSEMRRQGVLPVIGVFVGVCLILGLITDAMTALSILTVMGPLILILDYAMRTDKSVEVTMAMGCVLFILSFGFILYRSGLLEMIRSGAFVSSIESIQAEVIKNAGLTAVERTRIQAELKTLIARALNLFPAFVLLSGLLMTYLSYRISGRNMRLAGEKVICPGPFFLLRLPKWPIMAATVITALAYVAMMVGLPEIEPYVLNGVVILIGLFSFQGLAIANFFLLRYVRSQVARGLIFIVILMLPIGQMALAAMGLIDQFLNIRGIQGA